MDHDYQVYAAEAATELLPCPFCGSAAQWIGSNDGDYVECGGCLATMPPHDPDVPDETARWNTRAAPPPPAGSDGWRDDYVLPCDVHLPPATVVKAGNTFATLKLAMEYEYRPRHFDGNPRASLPTPPVAPRG